MREISVEKLLGLTSISSSNDNAMYKLLNSLGESTEDVLFNFDGVDLISPEKNEGFKRFIVDPRVHIKLVNEENKKRLIDTLLILSGVDASNKVINEVRITQGILSKSEKAIERMANNIAGNLFITSEPNGEKLLTFRVADNYTQLGDPDTVRAIGKALSIFIDLYEGKLTHIKLDLTGVMVQDNIYTKLATFESMYKLKEKGVLYEVVDENDENKIKNISKYAIIEQNKHYSKADRFKLISNEISKGTVVILHRFKETKKLNEFGQKGDGEYYESRPAIYLGAVKENGEVKLRFRSFSVLTFFTDQQYYLEHEGEEVLESLDCRIDSYSIDEIGYSDYFTGTRGHFHLPIQFNKKDMWHAYFIDKVKNRGDWKYCILPEYIKLVLDSWIEREEEAVAGQGKKSEDLEKYRYNVDKLNDCITKSLNMLGMPPVEQRTN